MTDKREAPASLEQELAGAFRDHHARPDRRRRTQQGVMAILAVAALFAAASFVRLPQKDLVPADSGAAGGGQDEYPD